jgi:hypothetical protein
LGESLSGTCGGGSGESHSDGILSGSAFLDTGGGLACTWAFGNDGTSLLADDGSSGLLASAGSSGIGESLDFWGA